MRDFFREDPEEKALREKLNKMIINGEKMEVVFEEAGVSNQDELDEFLDADPFVKILKPISIMVCIVGLWGVDSSYTIVVILSVIVHLIGWFLIFVAFGAKAFSNV
ncbi:hypothetical protein [Dechloromonas sp. ZS-1]|uniref:hypothetical protein n=1 Tax=Dechloromonas sp. ZS-1 TaxID=3138067 RepID=UPI0031FC206A